MSDFYQPHDMYERYQRLQRYVGWTDEDARRVKQSSKLLASSFDDLINDFYATIETESEVSRVITGGAAQIARLKETLKQWLQELFAGNYNRAYVERRWRVGGRHVELGLEQAFTNVAMSRLRDGLLKELEARWTGDAREMCNIARSISRLIDLDLAIIQDAYEAEHVRRQREAERKRSEAAFRQLIEAAGSMVVILRPDHTIAYFNPFAETLTGYAASAVMGKDYFPIFLPDTEQAGVAGQLQQVLDGTPTRNYENSVLCRDGSLRCLVWNAQRLDDYEGAPAVLAIGQDITERTKAEQRALQAERLAAIGQTVTGLAHESRNAFQRSQACLELLELELEGQPQQLELVSRIQRALDHLHRLYEEVRDYAAPINLDRQMCDLAHLWREAWAQLELVRQERNVTLTESSGGVDLDCSVDWFAMGQVFRNILENAISACKEPGEIKLQCRAARTINGDSAVEVRIQDNGSGIPPEIRDEVFDAFFTTKTKGTGLGMAIARRIVEAHGGQLEVGESGGGAEFILTLPR